MSEKVSIPVNYTKSVDWVIKAYENAGVTFANGFQKDAIQNAQGARKSSKWKGWQVDISVKETEKGQFVVIEDQGTLGLTGKNRSTSEIDDITNRGESIPPEERLSRFSSMFNSGGNEKGAGLYGAGKSVYAVASKSYTYYFDSLREDKKYVANENNAGKVNPLALEGEDAKKYIFEKTGLLPKDSVGTRVIIAEPKEELINAINSGEIKKYIIESWWLIIERLDNDSCISVNGNKVSFAFPKAINKFDLEKSDTYQKGYIVKHFGLYILDASNEQWNGISYYRKGMRIGDIELKDLPEKLKGKVWGYIEVEENWENELAEIEDNVHFGVSKGKKLTNAYKYLKQYCNEKLNINLKEWGYIKNSEDEDRRLRSEFATIAEDVQQFFNSLGLENLGKGPKKGDFDLRWINVRYPEEGTERVTSGDELSFSFKIKNLYATDKKFKYKLSVKQPSSPDSIYEIVSGEVSVKYNAEVTIPTNFRITQENSVYQKENRIELTVSAVGSSKLKIKELSYFYDVDKELKKRNTVDLRLHEASFPRVGSRRINFGESINNVTYRLENKRNISLKYKIVVGINNLSDPSCSEITKIHSEEGSIEPFEEKVISRIEAIHFAKDFYSKYLSEGKIQLRAKLIANGNDDEYEKGDKITHYYYDLFLNCDDHEGFKNSFEAIPVREKNNYNRSWHQTGNSRSIFINIEHEAYKKIEKVSHDLATDYIKELIMKEYVLLYMDEGMYNMFSESDKEFTSLEPQEAVEIVLKKIEQIYYRSLMSK